jgi:NAD(P)-dependent dehydrogenase (short-subunit alcohol dehydrogenase family)
MPTLLITGANRGIGLELTKRYAADGWTVIATCREPQSATALKAIPGVTVEALDVTDYAAVDKLAQTYHGTAIDLLLNNAGIYGNRDGALSVSDFDTYLEVLRVNSVAPMKVALAFLPHLKAAQSRSGGSAKIATISSRMGSISETRGGSYAYRASKAAINAGMRNLALDLKSSGISCITLHPGWVKTDMGGAGADIDVATSAAGLKKVIDGLTLDDTGKFYNYDGGEIPW